MGRILGFCVKAYGIVLGGQALAIVGQWNFRHGELKVSCVDFVEGFVVMSTFKFRDGVLAV